MFGTLRCHLAVNYLGYGMPKNPYIVTLRPGCGRNLCGRSRKGRGVIQKLRR